VETNRESTDPPKDGELCKCSPRRGPLLFARKFGCNGEESAPPLPQAATPVRANLPGCPVPVIIVKEAPLPFTFTHADRERLGKSGMLEDETSGGVSLMMSLISFPTWPSFQTRGQHRFHANGRRMALAGFARWKWPVTVLRELIMDARFATLNAIEALSSVGSMGPQPFSTIEASWVSSLKREGQSA
jgi:hypothetical protein